MPGIPAYAAFSQNKPLRPFEIDRREAGARDIEIEILYCGVCHSDVHIARNEWSATTYPLVPGHEIVGTVASVGEHVKSFKPGDLAGVGCMVGSCRDCPSCRSGLEQYCEGSGVIWTYNSPDPYISGRMTYGGYSTRIVVDESFVLRIPVNLPPAAVAPLLCAGITTYSPLRHWNVSEGRKVGIVGLGGLGHVAIKIAHAMGAYTVLFTTSPGKADDAARLGADEVVISKDKREVTRHANSFDFILNTVSAPHNLDIFIGLLKRDATICLVGVPEQAHPSPGIANLIFKRRQIAGSLIGGIKETQEMLDFCSEHNIGADIEMIPIQSINEAYDRMVRSDVKYRFVVDTASLKGT